MKFIFWSSFCFISHTYFGYPLYLFLLCRWVNRKPEHVPLLRHPLVSVVIAVFNEEENIEKRIKNLLEQNYPAENLEIVVVSDASTDSTHAVAQSFYGSRVRMIVLPERGGKAVALNTGIAQAKGEIVVFTDARQTFAPDVITRLVMNFTDPSVGCVSGELVFYADQASVIQAEMGSYWRYEKLIRKMESQTGSVVGATGAIYAIRRTLYKDLPAGTLLDDVLTPLFIAMQRYRCRFDSTAVAFDVVSRNVADEWHRKVRTLAGNWQLLSLCPRLAVPGMNPLWWRFFSHKLFRVIVPFALILMFFSGMLIPDNTYRVLTVAQLACYGTGLLSLLLPNMRSVRMVNFISFFLVLNAAALVGFWKWITGGCATIWQPVRIKNKVNVFV